MKATILLLGAILAGTTSVSVASAQYYYPPAAYYCGQPSYPVAPDLCGPYFYCTNGYTWYGPSYNVYPPFPPVGGMTPGGGQMSGGGQMPAGCQSGQIYHPWARSPRDFFMWTEAQKERITRETRPPFIY